MLRHIISIFAFAAVCRGEAPPAPKGGAPDVFPTMEERIGDLEARVQKLELQVGVLLGTIVVRDGQYQLRPGDTGVKIALMFGISLADLNSLNPGQAWTKLKVGQFVRIEPRWGPNHSPDPTPASVTPAAGQPPRQP
jgi:hypothetical protein